MAKLYTVYNGAGPTAAAQVPVTTGTAVKTLLQLATPATVGLTVVEWGISFNGSTAATPIKCELLSCTGAATVTALADADITRLNPTAAASLLTLGTSATGYTASAEGTLTNVDEFDVQFVPPTGQYVKQWPLGREPQVAISRFVRIRVTATAAVDAYCYICWEEG